MTVALTILTALATIYFASVRTEHPSSSARSNDPRNPTTAAAQSPLELDWETTANEINTLSTDVEIRLRSPREREAFAEELLEAIARLAAKYHDETHPDGRTYRVVVAAHPIRPTKRKP